MSRIGVLFSGCGVFDGTEIHEAVLTMLELDRHGCEMVIMAPDKPQMHVIDHSKGEIMAGEERNCMVEAARIARGEISCMDDVDTSQLDGLVIPGGFGAAKNLSDFAVSGSEAVVDSAVARVIREMHEQKKPIVAVCIAPAVVAAALGDRSPELTIGTDEDTAKAIESMGGKHVQCPVDEFHVDSKNRLISTPAYMLGKRITDVHKGIAKAIDALMQMI